MTPKKTASLRHRWRILIAAALAATVAATAAACGFVGRASHDADQGASQETGLPSCPFTVGSTVPQAGADYTVRVPARFGWLPANLVNEVDQGPSNGTSTPATYNAWAYLNSGGPDRSISLIVYPDAELVPGQHQPAVRCTPPPNLPIMPPGVIRPSASANRTPAERQSSAPPVNGAPAYWLIASGGTKVRLVWKGTSGTWISLAADNLPMGSVQATLEHVAETLTVGDVPLPQPVQVKGIPAAAQLRPGEVSDRLILPGDSGNNVVEIPLYFGTGTDAAHAIIYVLPAGHKDNLMMPNSPCETANNLSVCVEERTGTKLPLTNYVPGGAAALLAHVVSLGPDQANWSPDLIVGTG